MDITPLIDVVFLLLIFFMLTFSLPNQGISLSLPEESSGSNNLQTPLTIKVNRDGSIELNNKSIDYDVLVPELEIKLLKRKDKTLIVDIDKKAEYNVFVLVLDMAKKAGVENFSIIQ